MFDLKQKVFLFCTSNVLMNPVIDQRAKNCLLHNEIQLEKDAE